MAKSLNSQDQSSYITIKLDANVTSAGQSELKVVSDATEKTWSQNTTLIYTRFDCELFC